MATASKVDEVFAQLIVGVKPVPLTLTFVTNGIGVREVGKLGVVAEAVLSPFVKFNVQEPRLVGVSCTPVVKRFGSTPSLKFGRGMVTTPFVAVAVVPPVALGTTEFSPN